MNKVVYSLVTASLLVAGSAAFGQQTKQSLRDNQMDSVTAGSAIAFDRASVTSQDSGSVSLSGSALSDASGVNIVSESNSLVANGVNIADTDSQTGREPNGKLIQVNDTQQTEADNAKIALTIASPNGVAAKVMATNIAAGHAHVNTTNDYSVDLAGSAEEDANAVNIVNAAGGMVSNGVNIAHTSNVSVLPTLTQVNYTSQSR